ncbi:MAG: CDP-alcohol phosphatidyltransferase family protein [Hyphomonadaceae bacterium]|nr:CDP-alcohol phosphatidyltransferase family protein [Hyphomonadaceae bacterium]
MSWKWLPNALTLLRCLLALLVAGAVLMGTALSNRVNAAYAAWLQAGQPARDSPDYPALLAATDPADLLRWPAMAFAAFLLAALTDLFDGIAARRLDAQSAFGAWLDPIADKLLVGLALASLAIAEGSLWLAIPAAIIICRDIYITWLRGRLGGGYALPVMQAAKWKTALEMLAIGILLVAPLLAPIGLSMRSALPLSATQVAHMSVGVHILGLALTWVAATLSAWTGWRYWHAASHAQETIQDAFD